MLKGTKSGKNRPVFSEWLRYPTQRDNNHPFLIPKSNERNYAIAEVFPEYAGRETQVALRAYRHREDLTQRQLAELIGIPQRHVSEMENGKRAIGKEMAKKLSKALHADYKVFL